MGILVAVRFMIIVDCIIYHGLELEKEDINGTNCPTYELINNYVEYINKYFAPINCTEFECCTMNYAIDRSVKT